ncbi:MAG: (2Fe-2S)-binding protein [Bryobacterales bacterium]|nr:(2Fe-2S)-binding protein [Acidobacteriota bacterium]MCB9385779.1 (2Fe-2S)-binding protein [Bryobacterales bacterium]
MVKLTVNGVAREFDGDPRMPLLWYLRDILSLTGSKFGCGMGLCGCCTVHLDGVATRSCITTMESLEGKKVVTIEALSDDGNHPVQKAWRANYTPQCGYCQPGQIMQAASLLAGNKAPTDADIDSEMQGNICRCGTYQRIRASIHEAAKEMA